MGRRIAKFGVWCVLLLWLSQFAGAYVLKHFLLHLFAKETGCTVTAGSPDILLFSLSATLDEVTIRCPSDPADGGFKARQVWTTIRPSRLFHRQVLLPSLTVTGVTVTSALRDGGFYKTLFFVLGGTKDPNKPPDEDFDVEVHHVEVRTDEGVRPFFVADSLGALEAHSVQFTLNRVPGDRVPGEYDLSLHAEGISARGASADEGIALFPVGEARARATKGHLRDIAIDLNNGTTASAELRGAVHFDVPEAYDLSFGLTLPPPMTAALGQQLFPSEELPTGAVRVAGIVRGPEKGPVLTGHVDLAELMLASHRIDPACVPTSAAADFSLSTQGVEISELHVPGMLLHAQYRMAFLAPFAFSAAAQLQIDTSETTVRRCIEAVTVQAAGSPNEAVVTGFEAAEGTIRLRGALAPLAVDGETDLLLRVGNDEPFHLTLQSKYADTALQLWVSERLGPDKDAPELLRLEGSWDRAEGSLSLEKLKATDYPLRRMLLRATPFLAPDLRGKLLRFITPATTFSGSGALSYDLSAKRPRGELSFGLREIGLSEAGEADFDCTLRGDGTRLDIESCDASSPAGKISVNGQWVFEQGPTIDVRAEGLALDRMPVLSKLAPDRTVNGDLSLAIRGSSKSPTAEGSATVRIGSKSQPGPAARIALDIRYDATALSLSGTALNDGTHVSASLALPLQSESVLSLDITSSSLPVGDVIRLARPGPVRVGGTVAGTAHYKAKWSDVLGGEGQVQLPEVAISAGDLQISGQHPLLLQIKGGRLEFSSVVLQAGEYVVSLTGALDRKAGWQAAVSGSWELATLVGAVPAVESLSGKVELQIHVNGPLAKPSFEGPLTLRDARISVPFRDTIVGMSAGEVDASFSGDALTISRIAGKIGAGTIEGSGTIRDISSWPDVNAAIQLGLHRIAFRPWEELFAAGSGELQLRRSSGSPWVVDGELQLQRVLYESRLSLFAIIRALLARVSGRTTFTTSSMRFGGGEGPVSAGTIRSDVQPAAPGAPPGRALLNIHVRGDNGMLVDTPLAKAELRADLTLGGSSAKPTLSGSIDVVEGSFGIQSNEFTVVDGRLTFSSREDIGNPGITLLGETTVTAGSGESHQVRLSLGGTLRRPEVEFSSDSGLSREEIQGMLGIGAQLSDLDWLAHGDERSVAQLLNPTSDISITERVKGLAAFSQVYVDTVLSSETGEVVPRVVGRRPLVDKLDFTVTSELGANQGSTAGVEYPLGRWLTLNSGWQNTSATGSPGNTVGAVSAGVTFRYDFHGTSLLPKSLFFLNQGEQEVVGQGGGRDEVTDRDE